MGDRVGQQHRVVQWATGNIGTRSLRGVIEHPDLTLVGLYVHGPEKAGRDAGDLVGHEATGVIATQDIEEIVALGADCVLYMPRECHVDEVCRLLESGANIVTTRGEFHHPASMDTDMRERVESACQRGDTSIHSTGSSPGFISEAVPFVLTSIQRQLDSLTIEEFADLSQRDSPALLFELMGFGSDPGRFDHGRWSHGEASFGPSLRLVAEALGLPLDSVEASGEVATARRTTKIAAGTIEAGTVAASRAGAAAARSSISWPTGTAPRTSNQPGISVGPAGVSRSPAMRRWTSRYAWPFRSRGWATCRPGTRPTAPSMPLRSYAPPRLASAPRWISRRSSGPCWTEARPPGRADPPPTPSRQWRVPCPQGGPRWAAGSRS